MEKIYNIPSSPDEQMNKPESIGPDMENKFIRAIADLIIEALNIGWNDRRIVESLLFNTLKESIDCGCKNEGLLQQYESYVLELAGKRIKKELKIPDEIKINHSHATHAKYADIVDYLKKQLTPKVDIDAPYILKIEKEKEKK